MFRDLYLSTGGTAGIELPDSSSKCFNVVAVKLGLPFSLSRDVAGSHVSIGETFFFRAVQRLFFDEKPTTFVAPGGVAPLRNYGRQLRVLASTTS